MFKFVNFLALFLFNQITAHNKENPVKGMINPDSVCYTAFTKRGWKWGGDWQTERGYVDYHHFEKDPTEVLNE